MLLKGLSCVSSKVSRTVLRGGWCSNTLSLPDYLSASIADDAIRNDYNEVIHRVGVYDDWHDEEALDWADKVYVLDYSLPIPMMEKYIDKIVWIDHHRTAMDNLALIEKRRGKEFVGLRAIGKSGALLTWIYFYGDADPAPLVVQLVDDRDVWKWELGEDTAAFHEASRMFMKDYATWKSLLRDDSAVNNLVTKGHGYLHFIRHVVDTYNESLAWDGMFEELPVTFLNGSGMISGELHKRLRESHPNTVAAVVFSVTQDKVRVGMYRNDDNPQRNFSLGKIATKYGGGGHDGAAGFHTDFEEWGKIIKESVSASGYRRQTGSNGNSTNPRRMS